MVAAVTSQGLKLYNLDMQEKLQKETFQLVNDFPEIKVCEIAKFSPLTGNLLAVVQPKGVHVFEVATRKQLHFFERNNVASIEWSPLEHFLITCDSDPTKVSQAQQKNLIIWDITNG